HSTAGFIDPGFTGHVTLELSNVATLPITLWPGMKIGQLCFFRMSSASSSPYGSAGNLNRYQGQRGPTASRAHRDFYLSPEFAQATVSGAEQTAASGTEAV
ncbi:MAG TPA: dCTP deaminase, partial [Brevibacterium senegalense]|nr:dCTP deaminase [Brevibacterium senegalense]